VLRRWDIAAEVEARLESGRTHQIRVHFAHARHPVVGDPVYGGRRKNLLSLSESQRSLARALLGVLPRQALHAVELAFAHPVTGEKLRIRSPLPADINLAIELLDAPSGSPGGPC
jgi:23S rRNA pseudouridine1911/1915/1917 synthase